MEESSSHDHDVILEGHTFGLPNHVKERVGAILEFNESMTPKPPCNKTQAEEINSSAVARKMVKNHLLNLRKKKNKDSKFFKNSAAGTSKWSKQNCDSSDTEDSKEDSKLIAREIITSPASAVILITDKSSLKLLQN